MVFNGLYYDRLEIILYMCVWADVSTLPGEVDDHETAEQKGKMD